MTNRFAQQTTEGLEAARDTLGGGMTFDTDVYEATIMNAYAGKSQSSAAESITVHLDINGQEYRQTLWVTNKNGTNWTQDKNDPMKRNPMQGFTTINDLCLLATGHPLAAQTMEFKTCSLWDFDARANLPKSVEVITSILGKKVRVAIERITEDKTKKVGDAYENTGEFKDVNEIQKVYHHENFRTVSEYLKGSDATHMEGWAKKNKGNTRIKAKGLEGKTGAPGSTGGFVPGAANGAKPTSSLFAPKTA